MKRIKEWRSWSVASKIVLIFLCALVPVNVLLIYSTQSYITALRRHMTDAGRSVMDMAMQRLDNQMITMERYLYTMSREDTDYIRVSLDDGDDHFLISLHSVYRDFTNNLSINSIDGFYYLFAENSGYEITACSTGLEEDISSIVSWLTNLEQPYQVSAWNLVEIEGESFLLREVSDGSIRYGSIIELDKFVSGLNENISFENSSISSVEISRMPENIDQTTMVWEGDDNLCVYADSGRAPIAVELQIEKSSIYWSLPMVSRAGVVCAFACLLIIPVLYTLFHRMILRPLGVIDKAFHAIESGEADYRIVQKLSSREFSHMKHSFNRMADQIMNLKIESYERELEKNKILMRNIQLQVRPHFMLNLFHLIYSMAQIQNFKGIQEMSLYLSRYFRRLFSDGDTHTLQEECELVAGYFNVLYTQYPDCFGTVLDLDSSLQNVLVPTFLVHSLVENIAKYAISVGNYINITLRSYLQGAIAVFEVEDDGPGIEPAILDQISCNQPVEKDGSQHIGIWNARKRLKLLCGEQADILVESKISEGTKITVLLPLKKKEEKL